MNDSGSRGSERGSIEPRRGRQTLANLWDWDPLFRSFFPSNWQQMFGIDVNRKDDNYEIELAVPGYKPEDIDISYQDGVLTVSGRNPRRSFTRMLTVPEDIDENTIEANVENGVLTITMRQHPKAAPKKIAVGERAAVTSGTTTGATTGTTAGQQQPQTAGGRTSS